MGTLRFRITAAAALTALAAILGCEGNATGFLVGGATNGVRVRLINALPSSTALDFGVDGQVAATGVAFGSASNYVPTTVGSHRLTADGSATGTTLVDFTRDLTSEGAYSLIPAPGLAQFGALFLTDDPVPASGQAKIRVVHVAPTQNAVSVYVTTPNGDLASATPTVPTLLFGAASPYFLLDPGTYRFRVTPVGSPSSVIVDSGSITVGAGAIRTVLLTDSSSGGLPTTLSIIADAN